MKTWILDVDRDPENGDAIINLPQDLLDEADWKEGDEIEWIDNKDGSWTMKKIEKNKNQWVLVETLSQYRMRYLVEVPSGKKDWALDTVTCEEAKEFSQHWLGETISSHRVLSEEEALQICDEDNDYARKWSDEVKIKTFFTKNGEKVER